MFKTTLSLSNESLSYLNELGVTQEEITSIENDNFFEISDVNRLIKILFACSKKEDAWDNIKANLDVIDFKDILSCPFMQLDRDAVEVYKYMYDHNIIDKKSYMYFEVLSSKLNDWSFWKSEMEGLTTTQKLELLHNSFNDIFVQQNVNPYQMGLIDLTDEQYLFIFDNIQDGELVDFIFEDKPCINVSPKYIQALLLNGNLNPAKSHEYFKILYEVYAHSKDISSEENKEFYFAFFDMMYEYVKEKTNTNITDFIIKLNIDILAKLKLILEWAKNKEFCNKDMLLRIVINNPLTLMYPYTILEMIDITEDRAQEKINVSRYLDNDTNLSYVLSYMLNPLFDTSGYIVNYPFPSGNPIIYDTYDNMILFGKEIKPYDESDEMFAYIDNYKYAHTIDEKIFKNFNSEDEYKEFIKSSEHFLKQLTEFLG